MVRLLPHLAKYRSIMKFSYFSVLCQILIERGSASSNFSTLSHTYLEYACSILVNTIVFIHKSWNRNNIWLQIWHITPICEFIATTPPKFNFVERPQDLSQLLYNFYTLLLRRSDNFPSLLDVEIIDSEISLHPTARARALPYWVHAYLHVHFIIGLNSVPFPVSL